MQKVSNARATFAARVRAAWRVRACSVGLCVSAQVFLSGAGVAAPLCLNAAWIAALCALPAASLTAFICCRALRGPAAQHKGMPQKTGRIVHAVLCAAFILNAVFAAASMISLAEQSLLPQAQASGIVLTTAAAAFLCALSGTGVSRLSFALRYALPAVFAALCVLSLPLNEATGLFPLLGAGGVGLCAGCACMLCAAFPVLMLLYAPPEIARACAEEEAVPVPETGFFIRRVLAGAAAGAALLFVITLGGTYRSSAEAGIWGQRLLILSSGKPREGIAQTGLTVLEMLAVLLLCAHMLQSAQRALRCVFSLGKRMSLTLCSLAFLAVLCVLIVIGFRPALAIAPCLLAPLALALIFHRKAGGRYET